MADIYISKSGTPGGDGSIGDPVATLAQAVALLPNPALDSTIIFRAGTYDSELDNNNTSGSYHTLISGTEACNMKGYEGETVILRPNHNATYFLTFLSSANNSGETKTLTIENLSFTQNGSTHVDAFLRPEIVANVANKIIWHIKNCTFTQTTSDEPLENGAIFASVHSVAHGAAGQEHIIDSCTFNLCRQHICQFMSVEHKETLINNDITITQKEGSATSDITQMVFFQGVNGDTAKDNEVHIENNRVSFTLDDFADPEQLFQLDYINKVHFNNNNIKTFRHPNNTTPGGTMGQILRCYQSGPNNINSHTGRELKSVVACGNVVIRDDSRGDFISLQGVDGGTELAGTTVKVHSNIHVALNEILRQNDSAAHFFINTAQGRMANFDFKYNLVRGFQDGIQINACGSEGVEIAYNVFENMGEDAAPQDYTPLCVWFKGNVGNGSSVKPLIKNNIFHMSPGQKQYGLYLSTGSATTHAVVKNNIYYASALQDNTDEDFKYYYTSGSSASNHSFDGNYYLNPENLRINNYSYVGENKNLTQTLANDANSSTTNLTCNVKGKDLIRQSSLTRTLGVGLS